MRLPDLAVAVRPPVAEVNDSSENLMISLPIPGMGRLFFAMPAISRYVAGAPVAV